MTESNKKMISEKLILFKKIKELADRQEALLSKDRFDTFMSLIAQRSQIQRKIEKQDKLAKKAYQGLGKSSFDKKSGPIAQQISEVIASIQETDRKIEETLLKQRSGLISQIKDLRHGKKAVKGYGKESGYPPRYIDQHE